MLRLSKAAYIVFSMLTIAIGVLPDAMFVNVTISLKNIVTSPNFSAIVQRKEKINTAQNQHKQ